MEELIKTYIRANYELNALTLFNFRVHEKETKTDLNIVQFMATLKTIFGVSDDEFQDIWDNWVDEELSAMGLKIDKIRQMGLTVKESGVYASDSTLKTTIEIINNLIEKAEINEPNRQFS